jgi:AcrR family transcriptional regulator
MPSTRQRLAEAAVRRFYRDGFRNVGLDQVLADVGISKTAFYKHLECKDDLVLAALEMQNRWLQDTFRDMVRQRGGAAPVGQLRALLDVVDRIIDADDYQGCIFVNVAMEFPRRTSRPTSPPPSTSRPWKRSSRSLPHAPGRPIRASWPENCASSWKAPTCRARSPATNRASMSPARRGPRHRRPRAGSRARDARAIKRSIAAR